MPPPPAIPAHLHCSYHHHTPFLATTTTLRFCYHLSLPFLRFLSLHAIRSRCSFSPVREPPVCHNTCARARYNATCHLPVSARLRCVTLPPAGSAVCLHRCAPAHTMVHCLPRFGFHRRFAFDAWFCSTLCVACFLFYCLPLTHCRPASAVRVYYRFLRFCSVGFATGRSVVCTTVPATHCHCRTPFYLHHHTAWFTYTPRVLFYHVDCIPFLPLPDTWEFHTFLSSHYVSTTVKMILYGSPPHTHHVLTSCLGDYSGLFIRSA